MKQTLDKQFQALANKNRLAIFEYLRQKECACADTNVGRNVGEIAEQFDLALSTISHHLKVLHEAELINCEQNGQFVCCTINQRTVNELQSFFSQKTTK